MNSFDFEFHQIAILRTQWTAQPIRKRARVTAKPGLASIFGMLRALAQVRSQAYADSGAIQMGSKIKLRGPECSAGGCVAHLI